jgi:hypothetical protein
MRFRREEKLMRRREFIMLVGSAAATWPLAARAQQPDRMRLIGVLAGYAESDSAAQSNVAAFRRTLAKLGWTEGSNLRIELRWSAGNADRTRTFAKELVDLRPWPSFSALLLPGGAPEPGAPPCIRQRLFPRTPGDRQALPERVLAPQRELDNIGPVLRR